MADASAVACACRRRSSSPPPSSVIATIPRTKIMLTATNTAMTPRRSRNKLVVVRAMAYPSVRDRQFRCAGQGVRANQPKLWDPLVSDRHLYLAPRPVVGMRGLIDDRGPLDRDRHPRFVERHALRLDAVVLDVLNPVVGR